jgi:AraC family transcriptional regulator of adaptative response / DNA-3-methyladenine glycosylase II
MSAVQEKSLSHRYSRARKSRDARFDGVFFTAVKSTGIYCRPICPANSPLEKNVEYHQSAISAAESGFRPCLRCRPDSAPQSCAWLGSETTFRRAMGLIQQGALQEQSIQELAERLGISDRYLRQLFQRNLGTSPKKYAIYQQCLFAKQLLHDSNLSISEIAFASGFNSVRRFNEAIKQQLSLTPSDIRKSQPHELSSLSLRLNYRPPYAWREMLDFLNRRVIPSLEWANDNCYSRTIEYSTTQGYFTISANPDKHRFDLRLQLNEYQHLNPIMHRIRLLFDVDAPITEIDQQLSAEVGGWLNYLPGLRVPGIWSPFEAGIRAILGQQVSVAAARNLVIRFVEELGAPLDFSGITDLGKGVDGGVDGRPMPRLFPQPNAVVGHSLDFFRMPQSRKDTIRRLAEHFLSADKPGDIDAWLDIKGIGPWTVNYVKLRAIKDPDIWLVGDVGLKNAIKSLGREPDLERTRPWRSYLTFQMWNQLS